MNLANQMHKIADYSKNNQVDIQQKNILDKIKTNAELGLYSLEYNFKIILSKQKLYVLEQYLIAEGFKVEILNNDKTIFISWDN